MSQKGKYLKILNAKGMAKNVNRIKKVSKKTKRRFSRFSKTISLTRNLTAERSFFFINVLVWSRHVFIKSKRGLWDNLKQGWVYFNDKSVVKCLRVYYYKKLNICVSQNSVHRNVCLFKRPVVSWTSAGDYYYRRYIIDKVYHVI